MRDDVVDPELNAELLRILDVARRHDAGADRAGVVEALLADPIPLERRRVWKLVAPSEIARRQFVRDGVAGHVIERLLQRHVLGLLADHSAELGLPVDRVGRRRQLHRRLVAGGMPCSFAISIMWSV